MGRWSKNDQRDVAILKLTVAELHEEGATWQLFKDAFRQRYKMSLRTSATLLNCKRRESPGMKALRYLRFVARGLPKNYS